MDVRAGRPPTVAPPAPAAARRTSARRAAALPWSVPVGVLGVALLWAVPFAGGGAAARALTDLALGNWVLLLIWLVWSTSLAMVASWVQRAGRPLGRGWTVVQTALLLVVLGWALPPVLLAAPAQLQLAASVAAHAVLPVAALLLSMVQAVLLFLRA